MIRTYTAVSDQNIYDICLMTYGTLDQLKKLMDDNSFGGVDSYPYVGQSFTYDDTLVFNQTVSVSNFNKGINYCTRAQDTGGQYYVVEEQGGFPNPKYVPPAPIPTPPPIIEAGYFFVDYGNPNISTDGSGHFVYTDSRLIGITGYAVWATQLNMFLTTDQITYDPSAGSFTITIDSFQLIPADPGPPSTSASRLIVFINNLEILI